MYGSVLLKLPFLNLVLFEHFLVLIVPQYINFRKGPLSHFNGLDKFEGGSRLVYIFFFLSLIMFKL